jgi:hypothetical protein
LRVYRPGAATVGFDLDGPSADLVQLEREFLELEARIVAEGAQIRVVFGRIRDVSALQGGPTFVRFARGYVQRTPTFERCALHVVRSFVVRTIVDPIALVSPRITFRTFGEVDSAVAFAMAGDADFRADRLPFQGA